jgi:hypothetical protein
MTACLKSYECPNSMGVRRVGSGSDASVDVCSVVALVVCITKPGGMLICATWGREEYYGC